MPRRSSSSTVINAPNMVLSRKATKELKRFNTSTSWNLVYEELDDFEPWLDAVWLCTMLSEAILRHLRSSIIRGVHPGTGDDQPPIEPKGISGWAVRKKLRPNARGNTTGVQSSSRFYDEIVRGKVSHSGKPVRIGTRNGSAIMGTRATAVIRPGPRHRGFVAGEGKNGVEYFDVPRELIDKALAEYVRAAIKGPPPTAPDDGEKRAKDAK